MCIVQAAKVFPNPLESLPRAPRSPLLDITGCTKKFGSKWIYCSFFTSGHCIFYQPPFGALRHEINDLSLYPGRKLLRRCTEGGGGEEIVKEADFFRQKLGRSWSYITFQHHHLVMILKSIMEDYIELFNRSLTWILIVFLKNYSSCFALSAPTSSSWEFVD